MAVDGIFCLHVKGDVLNQRSSVLVFLYHTSLWLLVYSFMAYLRTSVPATDVEWNLSWPFRTDFLW